MAFSTHDIVSDSPTNNFCTLNSITPSSGTISDGNLKVLSSGSLSECTFQVDSGKWYFEYLSTNEASPNENEVLWYNRTSSSFAAGYLSTSGDKDVDSVISSFGATWGVGDIIGSFIDCSTKTVTFYKNGVSQGSLTFTSTFPVTPAQVRRGGTGTVGGYFNFGQDPTFGGNKNTPATVNGVTGPFAPSGTAAGTAGLFYYPPPADALALCTANLPDITPTLYGDVPQDYFKTVLYPGNGTSQSITGVGFQPDLVWLKARSGTNGNANHALYDSVRGVGANKELTPNDTYAEGAANSSQYGYVSTLDVDGFGIGAGSINSIQINSSSTDYVAWCMKAGGPPDLTSSPTKPFAKDGVQYETLSAANITAGTITPTAMSVNTDAGFSIVTYTGTGANATWGHGLSSAPEMVIIKGRTNTAGWGVYHSALGPTKRLALNTSDASETMGYFQNTSPTSTVFYITSNGGTGASGVNYIAYCWHSVEGYSKFGSYTGNGSADGPFIYCGFRPAFVMLKITTNATNWYIVDNKRPAPYNVVVGHLYPDSSSAESTYSGGAIDLLSNGFKIRGNPVWDVTNQSNDTYIFMAFAEQPFKFSNAR